MNPIDKIKIEAAKMATKLFLLVMIIVTCRVIVFIMANVPGTPECFNMPSLLSDRGQNYTASATGTTAVYANGEYEEDDTADLKPTFESNSYGNWVNSGLSVDATGTQTVIVNVAGSVFMNNYNNTVCFDNGTFTSNTTATAPYLSYYPEISGNSIEISTGTIITANMLKDPSVACGGSTSWSKPPRISWGPEMSLGETNASGDGFTDPTDTATAFSYTSGGPDWTDGGTGQGTMVYGANGIGMGVVLCSKEDIADTTGTKCTSVNDKNYDFGNQTAANSAVNGTNGGVSGGSSGGTSGGTSGGASGGTSAGASGGTSAGAGGSGTFSFFHTNNPTDSSYTGYGFTVTGTSETANTLAFNVYNCSNCYKCNYQSCNVSNVTDTTTNSCPSVSVVGSFDECSNNHSTIGCGQCTGNKPYCTDYALASCRTSGCATHGSNGEACSDNLTAGLLSGASSQTVATYYSQNKGQYALFLSSQDCASFGHTAVNCRAYSGSPTQAGILQMAITAGDPNVNPAMILGTIDLSKAYEAAYGSRTTNTPKFTYLDETSYSYSISNASPSGQIWYRVNDEPYGPEGSLVNNNSYSNNKGQFIVDTQAAQLSSNITSNNISPILSNIRTQLTIARTVIYKNIAAETSTYKNIILVIVNLYVAIYGILFIAGLIKANFMDVTIRLIKIGFVFNFLTFDGGWSFFTDTFLALFENGGHYLGNVMMELSGSADTSSFESSIFSFVQDTISFTFNANLWMILTTLMGSIGFILTFCLLYCMYTILKVSFELIISYVMAIISFSLIVSVSPIFIAFVLFERTRNYFRMWYQQLFYFALQPVLMFFAVLFLFGIMNNFLEQILNFSVCKNIFSIVISGVPLVSLLDYEASGVPIFTLIPTIFSLICLTNILQNSADLGGQIASNLTSPEGPPLSLTGKNSLAHSITKTLGSGVQHALGMDEKSKKRRAYAATRAEEDKHKKPNEEKKEKAKVSMSGSSSVSQATSSTGNKGLAGINLSAVDAVRVQELAAQKIQKAWRDRVQRKKKEANPDE